MLHIAICETAVFKQSHRYQIVLRSLFTSGKKISFLWVSFCLLNILRMVYTSKNLDTSKYFLHIYRKNYGKVEAESFATNFLP